MTMSHAVLAGLALIAGAIYVHGSARTVAAPTGPFVLGVTANGGAWRMDTATGVVSVCAVRGGLVNCSDWP
jgi:hypothetical protein